LTVIGLLLLLVSLAGICFGIYMATDPRTRGQGTLFAVWWVPGVAAASGVLMRDVVTVAVGLFCLLVAGAVLAFEGGRQSKPTARQRSNSSGETTCAENGRFPRRPRRRTGPGTTATPPRSPSPRGRACKSREVTRGFEYTPRREWPAGRDRERMRVRSAGDRAYPRSRAGRESVRRTGKELDRMVLIAR
jgi:hypothetical protein